MRRRAGCNLFAKAIKNSLLKQSFTIIRDYQLDEDYQIAKQGRSNQIAGIVQRFRLRKAMSIWRSYLFGKHKAGTHQTKNQSNDDSEAHEHLKQKIFHHQAEVGYRARNRHKLTVWFDNWRKYSFGLRDLRLRTQQLAQAMELYKKKRAVLKWVQRCRVTKKMRNLGSKCLKQTRDIELEMVFKAWKNEYLIDRYMSVRADKALNNLSFVVSKLVFQRIKCHA